MMILTLSNGWRAMAPQPFSALMGPSDLKRPFASSPPGRSGSSPKERVKMSIGGCLWVVSSLPRIHLQRQIIVSVSPATQMVGVNWAVDRSDGDQVRNYWTSRCCRLILNQFVHRQSCARTPSVFRPLNGPLCVSVIRTHPMDARSPLGQGQVG